MIFTMTQSIRQLDARNPMFQTELPIFGGGPFKTDPTTTSYHLASPLFSKEEGEEGKNWNGGTYQRALTCGRYSMLRKACWGTSSTGAQVKESWWVFKKSTHVSGGFLQNSKWWFGQLFGQQTCCYHLLPPSAWEMDTGVR